jgi:hypothetical protein
MDPEPVDRGYIARRLADVISEIRSGVKGTQPSPADFELAHKELRFIEENV